MYMYVCILFIRRTETRSAIVRGAGIILYTSRRAGQRSTIIVFGIRDVRGLAIDTMLLLLGMPLARVKLLKKKTRNVYVSMYKHIIVYGIGYWNVSAIVCVWIFFLGEGEIVITSRWVLKYIPSRDVGTSRNLHIIH